MLGAYHVSSLDCAAGDGRWFVAAVGAGLEQVTAEARELVQLLGVRAVTAVGTLVLLEAFAVAEGYRLATTVRAGDTFEESFRVQHSRLHSGRCELERPLP